MAQTAIRYNNICIFYEYLKFELTYEYFFLAFKCFYQFCIEYGLRGYPVSQLHNITHLFVLNRVKSDEKKDQLKFYRR